MISAQILKNILALETTHGSRNSIALPALLKSAIHNNLVTKMKKFCF